MQKKNTIFFFSMLAFVAYLAFKVISPYLSVIVVAFITVIIFNPFYTLLLKVFKKNKSLATLTTIVLVMLTFIIPLTLIINLTFLQTKSVYNDFKDITGETEGNASYETVVKNLNTIATDLPYVEYEETTLQNGELEVKYYIENYPSAHYILTKEKAKDFISKAISPVTKYVVDRALDFGSIFSELIPKFVVYIFLISALFPTYKDFYKFVKKLSPFDDDIDEMYLNKIIHMSNSMVKGSFIIAFVQGALSGILLWLLGVKYSFFLSIIMIFLSIIPLGAGVINIPIGIIMFLLGNYWQSVIILVNHFLVITNIDNILRPKLVSKDVHLPPVLTLIAVLGGIKYFGFMGFIYGPVIMIFFVTTLDIYLKNYKAPR